MEARDGGGADGYGKRKHVEGGEGGPRAREGSIVTDGEAEGGAPSKVKRRRTEAEKLQEDIQRDGIGVGGEREHRKRRREGWYDERGSSKRVNAGDGTKKGAGQKRDRRSVDDAGAQWGDGRAARRRRQTVEAVYMDKAGVNGGALKYLIRVGVRMVARMDASRE